MTETVVVAIITAVATLTASILASAVTSWLTMRSMGQQSEHQLRMAREARADERAAEHRRSRREAYVRFLTESLEATALVRSARAPGIPDGTFAARYQEAEAAVDGLIPAHGLVLLEGPDSLADAVQEVRDSLRIELDLVRAVRQGSKTDGELWEARTARATAAGAMAEKARKALGGDIDTAEGAEARGRGRPSGTGSRAARSGRWRSARPRWG